MFKILFPRIIRLSAMIFSAVVFFSNLISTLAISTSTMLHIGYVYLILLISILISSCIVVFNEKKDFSKRPVIPYSCITFTVLFLIANTGAIISTYITKGKIINLFNLYTMCAILAISIIASASYLYIKPKSPLVYVYNYFLIGLILYLLKICVSGFGTSASNITVFGVYSLLYALLSVIFGMIKYKNKEKQLKNEEYENQFSD